MSGVDPAAVSLGPVFINVAMQQATGTTGVCLSGSPQGVTGLDAAVEPVTQEKEDTALRNELEQLHKVLAAFSNQGRKLDDATVKYDQLPNGLGQFRG